MMTLHECLQRCDLNESTLENIVEQDRLSQLVAADIAACLLNSERGLYQIRRFLLDEIAKAYSRGASARALQLKRVLQHFDLSYSVNQSACA